MIDQRFAKLRVPNILFSLTFATKIVTKSSLKFVLPSCLFRWCMIFYMCYEIHFIGSLTEPRPLL